MYEEGFSLLGVLLFLGGWVIKKKGRRKKKKEEGDEQRRKLRNLKAHRERERGYIAAAAATE